MSDFPLNIDALLSKRPVNGTRIRETTEAEVKLRNDVVLQSLAESYNAATKQILAEKPAEHEARFFSTHGGLSFIAGVNNEQLATVVKAEYAQRDADFAKQAAAQTQRA